MALLLVGGIHAILYLILLGIFGEGALSQMEFPAVTLMSTVQITGGFLKRADALMFGVWFFTLFALLNSAVFYAGKILLYLAKECGIEKKGCAACIPVISVIIVFGLSALFYQEKWACDGYEQFLWYVGTPFLVIAAVIAAIAGKRAGRKKT